MILHVCPQSQIKLRLCYWFPELVSLNFTENSNYVLVKVISSHVLIVKAGLNLLGGYLHLLLFHSHLSMWRQFLLFISPLAKQGIT